MEVPEKDDYEVYLTAYVNDAGDGTRITIEAAGESTDFVISKTSGPFPGGENFKFKEPLNFERKILSGSIPLEAGKQIITAATSGIEKEGVLFHFRSFELLPVSKKEFIAAEEARAIKSRDSDARSEFIDSSGIDMMRIEELEREYGVTGSIKLASNENPFGPSPLALEAMSTALGTLHRYPDGSASALRAAIAEDRANGWTPRARVVAMANVGDDPTLMLNAPVPA